jgi:hypothetical protein
LLSTGADLSLEGPSTFDGIIAAAQKRKKPLNIYLSAFYSSIGEVVPVPGIRRVLVFLA